MHAFYVPSAPTVAECPHCRHVVAGVALPPSCTLATLTFHCPACAHPWTETRAADGAQRVWDPRPTAVRP